MRQPFKKDALDKVKAMGVPVASVIDVGVLSGTAELVDVYGDRFHLLVEPIIEWNQMVCEWYDRIELDYEFANVAASDFDGEMNMETSSVQDDQPITHARLTDKEGGANIRAVPVRRLDTLVPERNLSKPYLLKIDVDGVELEVIEGAAGILPDCSVVVVEVHPEDVRDRMLAVLDAGFTLFDIVDPCYYDGRLAQVDMVFINPAKIKDGAVEVVSGDFDYTKWEVYKPCDGSEATDEPNGDNDGSNH